jgi:hypothetical protein
MGGKREIDKRIDALGYARLTTFERSAQHLGNVLTPELLASLPALPASASTTAWKPPKLQRSRLVTLPLSRALLARVNTWSYNLLHGPAGE